MRGCQPSLWFGVDNNEKQIIFWYNYSSEGRRGRARDAAELWHHREVLINNTERTVCVLWYHRDTVTVTVTGRQYPLVRDWQWLIMAWVIMSYSLCSPSFVKINLAQSVPAGGKMTIVVQLSDLPLFSHNLESVFYGNNYN